MNRLPDLLALWFAALWVGGLWAIGYLAAPVLFYTQHDRVLAGQLAGHMFTWMSWVGLACGGYLAVFRIVRFGGGALRQTFFWIVALMLLLTLGQKFGIQPVLEGLKAQAFPQDVMKSLFRDRFQTWHGIASVVYLVESLLGLALLAKQGSR